MIRLSVTAKEAAPAGSRETRYTVVRQYPSLKCVSLCPFFYFIKWIIFYLTEVEVFFTYSKKQKLKNILVLNVLFAVKRQVSNGQRTGEQLMYHFQVVL